ALWSGCAPGLDHSQSRRQDTPAELEAASTTLMGTLEALADFGQKRVGTRGAEDACQYIRHRLEGLPGLAVRDESFRFPMHTVSFDPLPDGLPATFLEVYIDGERLALGSGQPDDPGFDVFEGSNSTAPLGDGSGASILEAAPVWVGDGQDDDTQR